MCRRTLLIGAAVAAFGSGFVLSCLIETVFIRVLIGAVLVCAGLVVINRR